MVFTIYVVVPLSEYVKEDPCFDYAQRDQRVQTNL